MTVRPSTLALLAGVIPGVTVLTALWISLTQGHVEHCNPYLDGCMSISAAARHGAANVVFKAVMIPYAVLLTAFWMSAARWLRALDPTAQAGPRWMPWLGAISAAFLVLYAVFLGSDGDFYRLMRRYGVTVYFSFNFLAQLLLAGRLQQLRVPFPRWIVTAKVTVCVLILSLGLANVAGGALLADNDAFENVIEWHAATLMTGYYLLTWMARRQ